MNPGNLTQNTWYIVYSKETKKVVGEIVFSSYNKEKDSIVVSHAIPLAFRKNCLESVLKGVSKYEFKRVEDLKFSKDHVHTRSPYYMKSWDALE
jgi:hypothetical protein